MLKFSLQILGKRGLWENVCHFYTNEIVNAYAMFDICVKEFPANTYRLYDNYSGEVLEDNLVKTEENKGGIKCKAKG